MNRKKFEERNKDLSLLLKDSITHDETGFQNLEPFNFKLSDYMFEKEDIIVYLKYSLQKRKYFFRIYKERK